MPRITSNHRRLTSLSVVAITLLGQAKVADGQMGSPPESKESSQAQPAPGSFETIKDGFRRVHRTKERSYSPQEVADLITAGRIDEIKDGLITHNSFADYLPGNWLQSDAANATGARVDSYGNPIVNEPFALSGWAQRDVDALRAEIGHWLLHMDNIELALAGQANQINELPPRDRPETYLRDAQNLQNDLAESPKALGNFVGQALVRQIDISDIMPLDHPRMTASVVDSIAEYLHFYENLKAHEAQRIAAMWSAGVYAPDVIALLQAHGHSMQAVLAIEAQDEGGLAGGTPFSCYSRSAFAVGWSATVGAIGLWHGVTTPANDLAVDAPIGFFFYYQPCTSSFFTPTGIEHTQVRVASNGYLSFFQHGGGSTYGTNFNNHSLPNAVWPDGFAAPWWDDLWVTNQGIVDEVGYKIEGAVGDRVFILEFWSVSQYGGSINEFYYFQVKLFEQSQRIQFHYSPGLADPGNESRTVGLEEYEGVDAECGPSCSGGITGLPTQNFDYDISRPGNDNCAAAYCISNDELVEGYNYGATGGDVSLGCGIDYADMWYRFTAPVTGSVTVNTCDYAFFDTTLAIFAGCGGTQIACNDDGCGLRSSVSFGATAGATYMIRVAGYNSQRGWFRMALVAAGVTGDTPETCNSIGGVAATVSGTTLNNSGCYSGCGGTDTIDEWLCWTTPVNGTYRVSTCNPATNFDTTLAVYRSLPDPDDSVSYGCNDNAFGGACSGNKSRVVWVVDAGVTYQIRVAGANGAAGTYQLDLAPTNCPADMAPFPAGDGQVNVADLLMVINSWGASPERRADFLPPGGNNSVDVADLLGVIGAWGICTP